MIRNYDAIGRLSSVQNNSTSANYVSSIAYNAANEVTGFTYGNSVTASFGYSAERLQLTSLSYTQNSQTIFSLSYSYTQNNGNNGQKTQITDNVQSGRSVTYTYDSLKRLKTAVTNGSTPYPQWGLSWTYDRYGNRTQQSVTHGSGPSNSVTVDTGTNRLADTGYSYDANGNMTADGLNSLVYDAENRVVSNTKQGVTTTYTYDDSALRLKKVQGSTTAVYVFSGRKVIAEYSNGSLSKEHIYLGENLIATHDGGTLRFHQTDHLSLRTTTDTSGTVVAESGHYPFGENWYESGGTNRWKFTTYERDAESMNDYAMFRGYVNRLGRFGRPDPLFGSLNDPQTLNRFSYVANDPINLIDPLGLMPESTCFHAMCGTSDAVLVNGVPFDRDLARRMFESGHFSAVWCGSLSMSTCSNIRINELTVWVYLWQVLTMRTTVTIDSETGQTTGTPLTVTSEGFRWVVWGNVSELYNRLTHPDLYRDRLKDLADGVVRGAGGIDDIRFIAGFYLASAAPWAIAQFLPGGAGLAALDSLVASHPMWIVYGSQFLESFGPTSPTGIGGAAGFLYQTGQRLHDWWKDR